jgi:hypothetical protein
MTCVVQSEYMKHVVDLIDAGQLSLCERVYYTAAACPWLHQCCFNKYHKTHYAGSVHLLNCVHLLCDYLHTGWCCGGGL